MSHRLRINMFKTKSSDVRYSCCPVCHPLIAQRHTNDKKTGGQTLTCLCWMPHRFPEEMKKKGVQWDQNAGTMKQRDNHAAPAERRKEMETHTSVQLIPENQADVLINAWRLQITPSLPPRVETLWDGEDKRRRRMEKRQGGIQRGTKSETARDKKKYVQLLPD